jgi:hypothetical protein
METAVGMLEADLWPGRRSKLRGADGVWNAAYAEKRPDLEGTRQTAKCSKRNIFWQIGAMIQTQSFSKLLTRG